MTRLGKVCAAALCAATAISLGGSALAENSDSRDLTAPHPNIQTVFDVDPVYATVASSDLDLASPEGAKTMLQRLHRATELVCQPRPFMAWPDWEWALWTDCVDTRMNTALTQLGSPMVTAAYAEERRWGRPPR